MEIEVTEKAMEDLSELPKEVTDTFLNAKKTAESNLNLGATHRMAFGKYLSGNMHPILQETLGRDYRAWFIEGDRINKLSDGKIFCIRILTAKEAHKIEDSSTFDEVLQHALE